MSNFIKPFLALVISVLIYAFYIFLADRGVLDFVQTCFYNPSLVNSYIKENTIDANIVHDHIASLNNKFTAVLTEPAVRSSFLYNQSAEDIYERSRIFGILTESTGGLQSVQFVDSNGIRIHYSTSPRDIISRNIESASYRNYYEDINAPAFDAVSVPAGGGAKFTMDDKNDRIIFSFPFTDSMDVYRGTALFYVSVRALGETLVAHGRLKVSDVISVIDQPPGLLLGSPETSKADIYNRVSGIWREDFHDRVILDGSGSSFSLIFARTDEGLFFGRLVNDTQFSVSPAMEWLFRLSMILTLYLTVFFLLNMKPHPLTLVQNRIKRLRENLFEQLYIDRTTQERVKWIIELEQRRDEIRSELKRDLKLRPDQETAINGIIDKSWNELLAVIKSGTSHELNVKYEKLEKPQAKEAVNIEETEEIAEVEEIGEAEAIDEADEMEEVEEIEETGTAEEIDELDEIGEIEEAEEPCEAEEIDELDEVNESEEVIDDAGDFEEIEEAEEMDEPVEYEVEEIEVNKAEETNENDNFIKSNIYSFNDEEMIEKIECFERKTKIEEITDTEDAEITINDHASKIEFNHPVKVNEDAEVIKLPDNLEIVSPFSDMFLSLDKDKDNTADKT